MKVTAACDKAFSPIVLTITINSQAELDNIKAMYLMNVTIPQEVTNRFMTTQEEETTISVVSEFLHGIAKALGSF